MKYCTKCGKQNQDIARFCTGCGAALIEKEKENSTLTDKPRLVKSKLLLYLGIAVLIPLICFMVWFFILNKDKQNKNGTDQNVSVDFVDTMAKNENDNSNKDNSVLKTKTLLLQYKETSIGDLEHQIFTDIITGQELELEYDENSSANWSAAVNEISALCQDNGNCILSGQMYQADMVYKLTDEYDYNVSSGSMERTGKKVMAWLVVRLMKHNNNENTVVSYNGDRGKLKFKSDCYVIITGSFTYEADAVNEVKRILSTGYSKAGYLWIPDFPSLSGKPFYSPYIGPFSTYSECEQNLRTLPKTGRFWYGVKVSQKNERIEIR